MPPAKTALIIDDEADYRQLLGEVLQAKGWKVLQAEEGDIGLALARSERPQVVLCDLLMPRCNGFQVCRALRDDKSLRHIRIIVTSGRDFEADYTAALEAGADEYLTKPIDLNELARILQRVALTVADPHSSNSPPFELPPGPVRVRFWGVRGSIPTPGPQTVRYGGNTSCVEIRADGQLIILDAGSGLRPLGQALTAEFGDRPLHVTVLLTHTHWDHIQGLPFFLPLYRPLNRVRILAYEGARHGLENILSSQMESPFFPVGLREVPANLQIEELKSLRFGVGRVDVHAFFANHPGICVGYRLNTSAGSVAFFPDNEPHLGHQHAPDAPVRPEDTAMAFARSQNQKLVQFLKDTDVLIMDTQYDCEEYRTHVGWGHGCVDDVVDLAIEANARQLFMFHHDPNHDDEKIDSMVKAARELAKARGSHLLVDPAREGQEVILHP